LENPVSYLYWKHSLVRTSLEGLMKKARHIWQGIRVLRHPGLLEVWLEDGRIERALRRLVCPDWNCVDVGAHLGSALSLFLRLAPRGKHLAFEPVAEKAAWLRRKFPEVEVYQAALTDTPGQTTFVENLSRPGFSGLRAAGGSDRTREIAVTCERLDDVVGSRRVHCLKVDVEGAELLVLRGATEILRRDRPVIVFESGPGGAERFGFTRGELYTFLTSRGYAVYLPKGYLDGVGPIDLPKFDRAHTYPFLAFNYLAFPESPDISVGSSH
jgi:FkbM family methyltransferase